MKLRIIFFLLAFCLVVANVFAAETKKTQSNGNKQEEFLGIKFGINHDELVNFLKDYEQVTFSNEKEAEGMKMYIYDSNHRLKNATGTMFSFFEDKLAVMGVLYMGTESDETFDALKKLIEDKYGKMKDELAFSGKKAKLVKGKMYFDLEYKHQPFETDQLLLLVGDLALTKKAEEKKIDQKAKSLGEL